MLQYTYYLLSSLTIFITLTNVTPSPTSPKPQIPEVPTTMLDAILDKCPHLKQDKDFLKQEVFEKCNNWAIISTTKELSKNTEENVLCLIYYDSITKNCPESTHNNQSLFTQNLSEIKENKSFCDNFTMLLKKKQYEHGINSLINETWICNKLCYDYHGKIKDVCIWSYYFAGYDVKPLKTVASVPGTAENGAENPNSVQIATPEKKTHSGNTVSVLSEVKNNSSISANQTKTDVINNSNHTKSAIIDNTSHINAHNQAPAVDHSDVAQENSGNNSKHKKPQETEKSEHVSDNTENLSNTAAKKNSEDTGLNSENTRKDSTAASPKPLPHIPVDTKKQEPILETNVEDSNFNEGQPYEQPDEMEPEDEGEPLGIVQKNTVEVVEEKKIEKPSTLDDEPGNYNSTDDLSGDSYFLSYFTVIVCLFFVGYVGYHNRQKILALLLEGKKGRRSHRGGRRPNSANYHKLDSNLEEALTSSCNKDTSHVIY